MVNAKNASMILLEHIPEGRRVGIVDVLLRDFSSASTDDRSVSVLFDGSLLDRPDAAKLLYDRIEKGVLEHPQDPAIEGRGLAIGRNESGFDEIISSIRELGIGQSSSYWNKVGFPFELANERIKSVGCTVGEMEASHDPAAMHDGTVSYVWEENGNLYLGETWESVDKEISAVGEFIGIDVSVWDEDGHAWSEEFGAVNAQECSGFEALRAECGRALDSAVQVGLDFSFRDFASKRPDLADLAKEAKAKGLSYPGGPGRPGKEQALVQKSPVRQAPSRHAEER